MGDNARAAALFLYNSCLGIFLGYGLFFNRVSAEFKLLPSATSLVFATFALLFAVSSILTGLIADRYGPRMAILVGGSLMSAGLIASGAASSFSYLIVSYGVIAGLGTGSMWLPTSLVVFESFEERKVKGVAGIVSGGAAFGTFLFSPIEAYVITSSGWRSALVIVGIIVLLFTLLAYLSSTGARTKHGFNLRFALQRFRSRRFGALYSYYLLGNAFARTLALIFVVPLVESRGLGLGAGALAVALIGAGSMFGRLATSIKGVSEESVASVGFVVQGACTIGLLYSSDLRGVALLSFLLGIGYGAYIPQFALLIRRYYGLENYGTIFGVLLTSFGAGAFGGTLFQGYELSLSGGYSTGFYAAGFASIAVGLHLLITKRVPAASNSGDESK